MVRNIFGKILDINNIPIYNATISDGTHTHFTSSDINGNYIINNIPDGDYIFTAHKDSYTWETKFITIISTQTIIQDFILNVYVLATIRYEPIYSTIDIVNGHATLTDIYNSIQNDAYISRDGRIFHLHVNLNCYNAGQVYINDSDTDELIIDNTVGFIKGTRYNINNIKINGGNEIFTSGYIHDLTIENGSSIRMDYVHDIFISNIIFKNNLIGGAIRILYGNNIKLYNIDVIDVDKSAIYCYSCSNIEVYNLNVKNAGDYLHPSTDAFAVLFDGIGTNCSAHDLYIDGTGWSSLDSTHKMTYTHFYNATVIHSGHNGVDLHGGNNIIVNDINIYDSVSNSILITNCENINIKNINSYRAQGACIQLGGYIPPTIKPNNIIFENIHSENDGIILKTFDVYNITLINPTSLQTENIGVTLTKVYGMSSVDVTVIDGNIKNHRVADFWLYDSINTKLINMDNPLIVWSGNSNYFSEYRQYYYLPVKVVDINNTPINDAEITFINEIDSTITSTDGYGKNKTKFVTMSTGQTSNNDNRINSPCIASIYKNSNASVINYTYTIIATYKGVSITVTNIVPDSTFYRINPNIPTNTITIKLPIDLGCPIPICNMNITQL